MHSKPAVVIDVQQMRMLISSVSLCMWVLCFIVPEYFKLCVWGSIPLIVRQQQSFTSEDVFVSCSNFIFYSGQSKSLHLCPDVCASYKERSRTYCRGVCPRMCLLFRL